MQCYDKFKLNFLHILIIVYLSVGLNFNVKSLNDKILSELYLRNFSDENVMISCDSYLCWEDAILLEKSLNFSIDPCENFYEFACGQWMKTKKLPKTEVKWDRFRIVQKQVNNYLINLLKDINNDDQFIEQNVKNFFKACTDTAQLEKTGIEPLKKILKSFGGWPIIYPYWFEGKFHLQKVISELIRRLGLGIFFEILIHQDLKNGSFYSLSIAPTSLVFPKFMLQNTIMYQSEIRAYKQWILKCALELLKNKKKLVSIKEIERSAEEIVNFERQIADISFEEDLDISKNDFYYPVTLEQLQTITNSVTNKSMINWLNIFTDIFKDTDIKITPHNKIFVSNIKYLKEVLNLFTNTNWRIIANYIGWRIFYFFHKDTTNKLRQFSYEIDTVVLGFVEGNSREEECLSQTKNFFSKVINDLYASKKLNKQTQERVNYMAELIREQAKMYLSDIHWMEENTQYEAIEKLNNMKIIVGNFNETNNLEIIKDMYSQLFITELDHFSNVLMLTQLKTNAYLSNWNKQVPKISIEIDSTTVNAFNYHNTIYILAGILNYPFYGNKDRLEVFNFGSLGFLIGHEIIHSFDNKGRLLDKNGNLLQWWGNETLKNYDMKIQCFINQYNKYSVGDPNSQFNYKVDGIQTVGENIADTEGLNLAFKAFEKYSKYLAEERLPGDMRTFSPKQLFFINFAMNFCEKITTEALRTTLLSDSHTPNQYRVIGAVSNSLYFAEAFKCMEDTPMNPKQKCSLW